MSAKEEEKENKEEVCVEGGSLAALGLLLNY